MEKQLTKKYGLFTAVAMVVGIVVGSGVFFKAQNILNAADGNMPLGIIAWLIGGAIMIICAFCFAIMAAKFENVNGLVDYAEATCGKKYAYMTGWFMTTIYYPSVTSVLAWLSARYALEVFGYNDPVSGTCLALAALLLCASYALNSLSPIAAGKFQVSATIIKLIPLVLTAVVGTVYGLVKIPQGESTPILIQNFATGHKEADMSVLLGSVVASAFAYEGWIIATSINAEIKNTKRNLPIALTVGTLVVMAIYTTYYIGVAGGATVDVLCEKGAMAAFQNIFGRFFGTVLKAFIAVSCLGSLNGMMLGCTRGIYSLAARNEGLKPKVFSVIDPVTNMPSNSAIFGLLLCAFWLFYYFAANLDTIFTVTYSADTANAFVKLVGKYNESAATYSVNWFGFDSSEIPIVTLYAMYLPIFVKMMKFKELSVFKRVVMPVLAVIGSSFMVFAAVYAHGWSVMFYLVVFALIMIWGRCVMNSAENQI